ncbi:MAG: SPOR domain-containing protein [Pseudomonadota bacterium]
MSRFDDHRMSFEPSSDDYRGFDLSEEEETARGPLILALVLGVLVVFAAVVWNTYRQGIREPGEVPLIRADPAPYKTAVDDQDVPPIEGLGETVLEQFDAAPGDGALGLRPRDAQVAESQGADAGAPAGTSEGTLQGGPAIDLTDRLGSASGAIDSPTPREDQLRALAQLALDELGDRSATAPETIDELDAPLPSSSDPDANAPDASATAPEAPKEAAPYVDAQSQTSVAAAEGLDPDGAYLVQLAAFRSAEAAETGWANLTRTHSGLFAGTEKQVQRADLDARGIFYRLRAGAFETRSDATAFCDALKADGGDCIVVGR